MRAQRGMTMIDVLFVLALTGLMAAIGITISLVWVQQQAARSAIYHVQSYLQLTRAQAATRNQACRFVIDRASGAMQVVDLNDPADASDDIPLRSMSLSPTVAFERPDIGLPITLPVLVDQQFQATFEANGTVSAGAGGEIVLAAGRSFHRITLFGAGGVRVERWDGSGWTARM